MSGPLVARLSFVVENTEDINADTGKPREVASYPLSWAGLTWSDVTMLETAIVPVIVERTLLLGAINAAAKDPDFLANYAQLKAAIAGKQIGKAE